MFNDENVPVPFPEVLGGNSVVDYRRVRNMEDEVPLAVVLLRNTCRPSDRAFEVSYAGLRHGVWRGFDLEHTMSEDEARDVFSQRIRARGAL